MNGTLNLKLKAVTSNIRKIREYRNYTQEYLAAKLAISQNAYSKIELGYTKITLDRLFSIATILEVDPTDLISLENSELIKIIRNNTISS
ncbi:MAG: transcriptional regulator [Mucilaginibacter sp.]|nr:transcriptional regulator [Mucilaginibacter sp.]